MKKIVSLLLLSAILLSLSSCADGEEYTEGLSAMKIEDGECVVSVGSAKGTEEIIIPKKIDGSRVVALDKRGFAFLDTLKSVSVPEGVYFIGDEAFLYCFALESVALPDGITHIGERAFEACHKLRTLKLSRGLERIEQKTFYHCYALSQVSLPDGLVYIGRSAFGGCSSLTEIVIPHSVKLIDEYAFAGTAITEIYIPEGTRLLRYVFNGCDDLKRITYGGTQEQWEAMMRDNEYGYEDTSYEGVEIIFER